MSLITPATSRGQRLAGARHRPLVTGQTSGAGRDPARPRPRSRPTHVECTVHHHDESRGPAKRRSRRTLLLRPSACITCVHGSGARLLVQGARRHGIMTSPGTRRVGKHIGVSPFGHSAVSSCRSGIRLHPPHLRGWRRQSRQSKQTFHYRSTAWRLVACVVSQASYMPCRPH